MLLLIKRYVHQFLRSELCPNHFYLPSLAKLPLNCSSLGLFRLPVWHGWQCFSAFYRPQRANVVGLVSPGDLVWLRRARFPDNIFGHPDSRIEESNLIVFFDFIIQQFNFSQTCGWGPLLCVVCCPFESNPFSSQSAYHLPMLQVKNTIWSPSFLGQILISSYH